MQVQGNSGLKQVIINNMNDDLRIITDLTNALTLLIKGENCSPVKLPEDYPDNEINLLADRVNEIIIRVNTYTESLFSISRGDLAHEIPKGRMKIHDGLKNLQAGLHHLTWKTQRIAGGDFNQKVDFMGEFSDAFNSMTLQLKQAFETIETQNIKLLKRDKEMTRDLRLAAVIQKALISGAVDVPGVQVHSIFKPMILIGGDFFTYVNFKDEEKLGIFIADVNGHGVNAALVTGILAVLINSAGELRNNPAELLLSINSSIVDLGLDIYFTAFYAVCDIKNRTFSYARGGHNLPYLILKDNKFSELDSDGPMLGVMKNIEIFNRTIDIVPGNKILLFTDGLTETENSDGEPFETKTLADVIKNNPGINIKEYVNNIYDKLIEFRGSEKFDDDVCILGIELL